MPTDGPVDPQPSGDNASSAEGSIFGRLRSQQNTAGGSRDGSTPSAAEEARITAGEGHPAVDSANVNPQVLAASREAAGSDADAPSKPGSIGAAGIGLAEDSTLGQTGFASDGPDDSHPAKAKQFELLAVMLFGLTVVGAIGFVLAFILGDQHKSYYTPALGVTLALALLGLGAGGVVWAKYVMPHEDAVQERHEGASAPQDILAAQETWRRGVETSGFLSRPLLRRSLLAASTFLAVPAVVLLRSLGTLTANQNAGVLAKTAWFKGAKMLQVPSMIPLKAGDLAVGGLATVIPEGTEDDEVAQAASVAIVVRLLPEDLKPLPGREGLDWNGHVVYSKICTHLGCPVSLYEQQSHRLLCPCHQSQFLATENARPVFGPAARRLPQLAVTVDADGYLVAKQADFPEPIGPSYWERT